MAFALGAGGALHGGADVGGADPGRGFRRPRHGRTLWAGAGRAWAGSEPARLRARARRARSVPGDGGGAAERRAGGGGGRSLAAEEIRSRHLAPPAARRARGAAPALLVQASAYGAADRISSAAETRFEIAAAPSAHQPSAGSGRGLPGRPTFAARLVKARLTSAQGPPPGLDTARIIRLIWRSEDKKFDEPAISLPLAAASGDGPRAARA